MDAQLPRLGHCVTKVSRGISSGAGRQRPIRVLVVVKVLGPGGAERLILNAAQTHRRESVVFDCVFLHLDDPRFVADLELAGVRCIQVGEGSATGLVWPRPLRGVIRNGHYDVVHIHSPLFGSFARVATRSIRRSKRPVVVTTEHNTWGAYHPITRVLNSLTSRRDAATVTVSEEVRSSLRGPAHDRARTLVHGTMLEAIREARSRREETRARLGFSTDQLVSGTVANFTTQKDYRTLLDALRRLADTRQGWHHLIVGHGPLEDDVREHIARLRLESHVSVLGRRHDVPEIMGALDVFVLASRWEGLPVVMMEALAAGLPIVATAVGGVQEALADQRAGLLVPAADPDSLAQALDQVLADPALRREMGTAALELSQEFDMRRACATLESIYLDTIATRHG